MFCKIELLPKQSVEQEESEELIWTFLCSLERNGQILKDYTLIKNRTYTLFVTLPKPDSFDEKHDGIYAKRDREKLRQIYDCVVTPLGTNVASQAYCACESHTAIEMQTYSLDMDSIFTCCDCGRPVALYELPFPAEDQEDYYPVQDWQESFASMDTLWIRGLCDRYTGNQRVKPDSILNRKGIEIAACLSRQLGIPVYYHLACDYGKSVRCEKIGDRQVHVCPKCQRTMKKVPFTEGYERDICNDCLLSYDSH